MSLDLADDKAWLSAFRDGDREALRRVFDAYVTDVDVILRRGTVTKDGQRRIVGVDSALVDDLIQDVFVKVFAEKTRTAYDGSRPFRPYLRQIARHTLIDHHRRAGREVPHVEEEPAPDADVMWMNGPMLPDDLAVQNEVIRDVQAFKAQLSDDERAFVQARFVEGMGQREVASTWKLTRTEVRKRDASIRDRLRRFLANRK